MRLAPKHVMALVVLGTAAVVAVPFALATSTTRAPAGASTTSAGQDVTVLPTVTGTPAQSVGAPAGASQPGSGIPTVPPQLSAVADEAVAAHPLLLRLAAQSRGGLLRDQEGPWHDGTLRLLGVARTYRLAQPVDTAQEYWPVVDYVDRKTFTTYRQGGYWMRVTGLRQVHVLVDLTGHVVEVRSVEHDGGSDIDPLRPAPSATSG